MTEIKLSILVPIYNVEKYLHRCVDSLLRQDVTDCEIVLVDDGSTDRSGEICDLYAKKNACISVVHQANGGLVSARNRGIQEARGTYIAFVDSDDWLEDGMYKDLLKAAEASNADICAGGAKRELRSGKCSYICGQHSQSLELASKEAVFSMYSAVYFDWSLCGKIYRRELFFINNKVVQFDEHIIIGEDILGSWILCNRAKLIVFIPLYKYHYCQNDGSLTMRPYSVRELDVLAAYKYILDDKKNLTPKIADLIKVKYVDELIYQIEQMLFCDKIRFKHEIDCAKNELIKYKKFSLERMYLSKEQLQILNMVEKTNNEFASICGAMKENLLKDVRDFCSKYDVIYIYGCGEIGRRLAGVMKENSIIYDAFVVSDSERIKHTVDMGKVYNLSDIIDNQRKIGIVIATYSRYHDDIRKNLINIGMLGNTFYPDILFSLEKVSRMECIKKSLMKMYE